MPELRIALGARAPFPALGGRSTRVRRLQGAPTWEAPFVSDFLLLFIGLGSIAVGLEGGASCCRVALVTATDASAQGAEEQQGHLPVCSSQAPPDPGAAPSAPRLSRDPPSEPHSSRLPASVSIKPRNPEEKRASAETPAPCQPEGTRPVPVAMPRLSPENGVCRARSFALGSVRWH